MVITKRRFIELLRDNKFIYYGSHLPVDGIYESSAGKYKGEEVFVIKEEYYGHNS